VVVQVAAAEALGQIEDPRAVRSLLPVLRSGDADLRLAAAEALGQIEDARAAEALTAAVSDADPRVRRAAIEALGQLDDLKQAPKPLLAALQDPDPGFAMRRSRAWDRSVIRPRSRVAARVQRRGRRDAAQDRGAAEQIDGVGASGF
jgi:HEAT repeat protein